MASLNFSGRVNSDIFKLTKLFGQVFLIFEDE